MQLLIPAGTDRMFVSVDKCMSSYQSPEPALFTVDVPALDGGKRHCVGVLKAEIERGEIKDFIKSKHTRDS